MIIDKLFSFDLVNKTWSPPLGWEKVAAFSHSYSLVTNENDLNLLTYRYWCELCQIEIRERLAPSQGVFPIYWEIFPEHQNSDVVVTLAHQVAEAWIGFLLINPDAYLDLRSDERHSLSVYLAWHIGSFPALITRLKHLFILLNNQANHREKDNVANQEEKKEAQRLVELLIEESSPYSKDCAPPSYQLLDWLQIRPPWLEHTFLIIIYRELPIPEWRGALTVYLRDLLKRKVLVKEFELNQHLPVNNQGILRWSDDSLMEILSLRVQQVTYRNYSSFTDLFVRPESRFVEPINYDNKLISKSQGSLSRMLELGQRILLHHSEYHSGQSPLSDDDFQVIEQE